MIGQESAPRATISVDASKQESTLSPLLYGQFAEFMFEDIKGGLYAELVRDRGFDESPNAIGLPRYWERYPDDRDDDAIDFHWDNSEFYPAHIDANTLQSQHSLEVTIARADGRRRGIRQSGIPVRAGVEYVGYLWVKSKSYSGPVSMSLEKDEAGGEQYSSASPIEVQPGNWKKLEFRLRSEQEDPLAQLAVILGGKGQLWIDQVSLVPEEAIGGIRNDVEQKIAALHPGFIRWPGGNVAQDYHWMWGIGPRDQRPVWVNLSWKNELEPSDFGTDEFLAMCRRVGAQPTLTVNVDGRGATADEAAAWVEYVNGPSTSKYGAMRAANGHPDPYHVKIWEIGNEIWGDWVRGHSDATTYARNLNRYVAKMKAVDPSIKIIGCGDNDMNWNRTVLKLAGANIDYLAVHHYYGPAEMKGDPNNLRARPLHYERFYAELQKVIQEVAPGRDIKVTVNEWNTTLPLPRQHSMESAIYAARLMNVFERSGGLVRMSAVSDLVNGWSGGIIQASRHRVFTTPTYEANALYASHLGSQRLQTRVQGPTFDSTLEGKNVPVLDATASRAGDGRRIFLKIVNTDPTQEIETRVEINGAQVASHAEWKVLNGNTLDSSNDFAHPAAVRVSTETLNVGPSFTVRLPEHSVSLITLQTEP